MTAKTQVLKMLSHTLLKSGDRSYFREDKKLSVLLLHGRPIARGVTISFSLISSHQVGSWRGKFYMHAEIAVSRDRRCGIAVFVCNGAMVCETQVLERLSHSLLKSGGRSYFGKDEEIPTWSAMTIMAAVLAIKYKFLTLGIY